MENDPGPAPDAAPAQADELDAQAVAAAHDVVEEKSDDRLRDQIVAENMNANVDWAKGRAQMADKYDEIAAVSGSSFHERIATGARDDAESGEARIERNAEITGEDYDKLMGLVNAIRARAEGASTPDELAAKAKMEELLASALYAAGITNPNQKDGILPNYNTFMNDKDIKSAQSYASQAGDAHRTPDELRAFLEANSQENITAV